MKTLQFLQGQFIGFHFLFSFLNLTREFIILTSLGICSHILGPKYNADSLPLKTLWIGSVRNVGAYLRLRCVLFLIWITSFIVSRDIQLTTFYISIASQWILLWCIETELSLSNSFSRFEFLSLKMILKQLSWSWLILLFKKREWNIQTIGQ